MSSSIRSMKATLHVWSTVTILMTKDTGRHFRKLSQINKHETEFIFIPVLNLETREINIPTINMMSLCELVPETNVPIQGEISKQLSKCICDIIIVISTEFLPR